MTLREHLEAIRDRHYKWPKGGEFQTCGECTDAWPCFDREHAVAALAILDAAVRDCIEGDGTCVLVLDPEPSA